MNATTKLQKEVNKIDARMDKCLSEYPRDIIKLEALYQLRRKLLEQLYKSKTITFAFE